MPPDIESTGGGDLSDGQMDMLVGGESSSRDIPMGTPQPQASPWTEDTFTANGKQIKASREDILKWASMGHNYPQKAQEFNKMKTDFEAMQSRRAELDQLDQKIKPYREIDEFATKNPDWWQQVQQSYQQKLNGAETNPEIQAIKQEFQQFREFMQGQQSKEKNQQIQNEDTELSQEVESIRKTYSNLDFDSLDEGGKSLEMKILEHAMNGGIKSFRVAFRDYCHDQLVGKAKEEGKEAVSKQIQQRTKLGILGETSKPTKGLKVAENVKDKSYEQLAREALDELGA